MKTIDLRSDTVTRPDDAMRAVMAAAEVGDDVFSEDPTINRLEKMTADLLGTETAIFAPSGTQSNLLALLSHCARGDEYIVGQQAHTYRYEGGGAAVLGSIQPQPIELEEDGTLDLDSVASYIKPDDFHFARTSLLCLENTQAGKALPMDYLSRASAFARKKDLSIHLDGARIFNAAVKMDVEPTEIARHFDTVSVCLSKGLGAPVGSLLCGPRSIIDEARKWRKMLGGGMRQAGIVAAAGIYALENNRLRLAEDHDNAGLLAKGLAEIDKIRVSFHPLQTNMVYVTIAPKDAERLASFLNNQGISILPGSTLRLVTHRDVNRQDIDFVIDVVKKFYA
ncbi:MAG: low-specificity L-threonine aldolase [Thermodesulfobacteriota bacterium]